MLNGHCHRVTAQLQLINIIIIIIIKHIIEEKIEGRKGVMGRRGRIRKQVLDDLREMRRDFKLKEEALDLTLWRTCHGWNCGPVVRQTDYRMNERMDK